MNKQSKLRWLTVAAAATLVAACAGCSSTKLHGERFEDDEAPRAVRNVVAVQTATGARSDATLHSAHFSVAGLNSLGRQKLDMMLQDEEASAPLVVYIELAKNDSVQVARTAVADYLKTRGLPESQFKIEEGVNPKTLHSAEETSIGLQTLKANSVTPGGAAAGGGTIPTNPYTGTSGQSNSSTGK